MTAPLVRELSPAPDPAACAERFAGCAHRLLLDSAARRARLGRYSFFMADPSAVGTSRFGRTTISSSGAQPATSDEDPLSAGRRMLAPHAAAPPPGFPSFHGRVG